MFGLEVGTIIIILVNLTGLGYYIVKTEQQTKANTEEIEELQKLTDKMYVDHTAFKIDAAQKFVTQDNLNKIEDKITFEIRRLGDKLDKMSEYQHAKGNKEL